MSGRLICAVKEKGERLACVGDVEMIVGAKIPKKLLFGSGSSGSLFSKESLQR